MCVSERSFDAGIVVSMWLAQPDWRYAHTCLLWETSKAEDTCVASFLHVRLPSCVSVSSFLVNT